MDLNDKTVLITGAARGIGGTIAVQLADRGAQLALVDLHEASLEPMRTRCVERRAREVVAERGPDPHPGARRPGPESGVEGGSARHLLEGPGRAHDGVEREVARHRDPGACRVHGTTSRSR